ncbi:methylenetetrahydrofolate reductase [Aidingimonas lacisalsi]|uniref:methylenetetrahydrofolate reductase n=1 Tax=Aidingimonas lacisalsi TaxID=2604086 RepID=UPI0011D22C58|nr:methylenetetrahydrofolate reductase [Aidingimonas lacisalsi]
MNSLVSRSTAPSELVLEAVPPELQQGERGIETVLEKIDGLHREVGLDAVNIPEIREESSKSSKGERRKPFEPRVEPRVLAYRIQEQLDLPCIINRVVVHLEHEQQLDWFRETREEYGVRRLVLVGGERSDQRYPGPSVPEATTLLRERLHAPDMQVGNICIPSRPGEAERMLRKMDAGADFFTTQVIFHAEEVTSLLDAIGERAGRENAPTILVSLAPVRSERNIRFLHWLGVNLSNELEEWLTAEPESVTERSLTHIRDLWSEIADHAAETNAPFPISANLAPIGRIPTSTTVSLARALRDRHIQAPHALGRMLP